MSRSSAPRPRRLVALAATLAGVAAQLGACSSQPPPPSGALSRPSGMLYVPRDRYNADLFIADSGAQGIRVLQMQRAKDATSDAIEYVSAPVVFFPLIIPAEGFPTRLAHTAQDDPAHDRIYALAPATSILYVLATAYSRFGETAEAPSNVALSTLPLRPVLRAALAGVPAAGGSAATASAAISAVNIATSSCAAAERTCADAMLVAFQYVTPAGAGAALARLVIREVPSPGGATAGTATVASGGAPQHLNFAIDPAGTSAVAVNDGPRDIVPRPTEGVVLASSSGTRAISAVATSSTGRLVSTSTIDVGGPTVGLVDARDRGVFALRLDRPSVVLLTTDGHRIARATRAQVPTSTTPYSDPATYVTDPDQVGRFDLPSSPVVSGAYGRLIQLYDLPFVPGLQTVPTSLLTKADFNTRPLIGYSPTSTPTPSEWRQWGWCAHYPCADVVALTQLDGHSALLIASNDGAFRLALSSPAIVQRMVVLDADPAHSRNPQKMLTPSCPAQEPPICSLAMPAANLPAPTCPANFVVWSSSVAQTLRVTYQGTLASSRVAAIARLSSCSPHAPPGSICFEISDPSLGKIAAHQILPGDGVVVQARSGVLLQRLVDPSGVIVGTTEPDGITNLIPQIEVAFAASSTLARGWPSSDFAQRPLARYEVFAQGAAPMVMAVVSGDSVTRVAERAEVVSTSSMSSALFRRFLNLDVTTTGTFECVAGSTDPSIGAAVGGNPGGAECYVDADCSSAGGACLQPAGASGGCLGRCTGTCPAMASCVDDEYVRRCPSLEVGLSGVIASRLPYQVTGGFAPSVPDQTIYVPLQQSFVVSFPGVRGLVQVKPDPGSAYIVGDIR